MDSEWYALRAWREHRHCPICEEVGEHHHTEDMHTRSGQREIRAWCQKCQSIHRIEAL